MQSNQKVLGSNPTRFYARLRDPILLQGSWWPSSSKLIKRSNWYWVSETVPSIMTHSWLLGSQIIHKKVIYNSNSTNYGAYDFNFQLKHWRNYFKNQFLPSIWFSNYQISILALVKVSSCYHLVKFYSQKEAHQLLITASLPCLFESCLKFCRNIRGYI